MSKELKKKLLSMVGKDLEKIENALHENLAPNISLVSDIAGHLLFSGGKRLRPLLTLMCGRLCLYTNNSDSPNNDAAIIKFSTIFEYLHAATLLHDDVVDSADTRRGRDAAHTRWSPAMVVLTGDYLLASSLSLAAETEIPALIKVMAGITEEMSQGEIDQMEKKGNIHLTEKEYLEIIRRKTAVLIQGACRSGAILTNAQPVQQNALDQYGYHLGMAFQMADDLLDYTSDTTTLGKKTGADIREGKLTLPLIHALSKADTKDKALMESIIDNPCFSDHDFNEIVNKIKHYNGIDFTLERAGFHVNQAIKCLDAFGECSAKKVMLMLAEYAIKRES
ncbi:IspB [Desulfamplus magnetovallimortis]|uniref:IspB n=1 Tax=Desulfamplus magnetovallimortis TaxID=1246637 RepID=A0A1W1H5N4_9BACT|nr:polyprenyl synthetase family protein [Desulfamplus magnetovallimortis]SLM27695.1 IspB [Desulfamplus magnetovallimortis]